MLHSALYAICLTLFKKLSLPSKELDGFDCGGFKGYAPENERGRPSGRATSEHVFTLILQHYEAVSSILLCLFNLIRYSVPSRAPFQRSRFPS